LKTHFLSALKNSSGFCWLLLNAIIIGKHFWFRHMQMLANISVWRHLMVMAGSCVTQRLPDSSCFWPRLRGSGSGVTSNQWMLDTGCSCKSCHFPHVTTQPNKRPLHDFSFHVQPKKKKKTKTSTKTGWTQSQFQSPPQVPDLFGNWLQENENKIA